MRSRAGARPPPRRTPGRRRRRPSARRATRPAPRSGRRTTRSGTRRSAPADGSSTRIRRLEPSAVRRRYTFAAGPRPHRRAWTDGVGIGLDTCTYRNTPPSGISDAGTGTGSRPPRSPPSAASAAVVGARPRGRLARRRRRARRHRGAGSPAATRPLDGLATARGRPALRARRGDRRGRAAVAAAVPRRGSSGHVSGATALDALGRCDRAGAATFSLHPLQTFADGGRRR